MSSPPVPPSLSVFETMDFSKLPTPCFIVDEALVEQNLKILKYVADESGAKVLAALKAFSMWKLAPLVSKYLSGACASGIHEALLAKEYYGGEVHVFSAAFSDDEFESVSRIANHVVLNSVGQYQRFKHRFSEFPEVKYGLRINPEHSEGTVPLYDPCSANSRLGITLEELTQAELNSADALEGISGLHFHTLCEQGFAPLDRTLTVFEEKFAPFLASIKWVNFGGGHHITHPEYDVQSLIERVKQFKLKHAVDVYLEPGEAVAINTGILLTSVLDIRGKQQQQAILDTSATCHMPDTLEMPYRPDILAAGLPSEKAHTYQLGGMTCLAGDNLGEYSFDQPLKVGDKLVFMDMSHYTMVKTTTFNGIALPSIAVSNHLTSRCSVVKEFGYDDFKHRLS